MLQYCAARRPLRLPHYRRAFLGMELQSLPHYHPHPQIHIGRYGVKRGWLQRMSLRSPQRRQGRWRVGRRMGEGREMQVQRATGVGRERLCFKKLELRGSCRGMP